MKKQIIIFGICLMLSLGFSYAAQSGPLSPTPFPEAGKASPMAYSKFFVLEAPVKDGKAMVTLPLDTPGNAIAMVLGESGVRAFTEDLKVLEPIVINEKEMKRMNLPSANTRFNLDKLNSGRRILILEHISTDTPVQIVVSQPETPLSLAVQVTPLAARAGETVTLTARILDKRSPLKAEIQAALPDQTRFFLHDTGLNGDKKAGDGIYSVTFKAPQSDGFKGINLRFTANGLRYDHSPFKRNAISSVMVTRQSAEIIASRIDAKPSAISVPFKAMAGHYRLEAIFGVNGVRLAYSREHVKTGGQNSVIQLPLPTEALSADRALIRLLNMETLGLEDELEISLTPVKAPPEINQKNAKSAPLPPSKAKAAELIQQ